MKKMGWSAGRELLTEGYVKGASAEEKNLFAVYIRKVILDQTGLSSYLYVKFMDGELVAPSVRRKLIGFLQEQAQMIRAIAKV